VILEINRTEFMDGTPTLVGRWTGGPLDGLESNVSFDSTVGARLWKSFRPNLFIDGVGFVDQLQEFDPPLLVARPDLLPGNWST